MIKRLKTYFPSTKGEWIRYIMTSLPIIMAAMILSMNSFIDNFMATSISGGNKSLTFANQWTQYCSGIIAATTLVGSSLFGQYLGIGDNVKIREVIRVRTLIALIIALMFFIPALSASNFLIRTASGFDENLKENIVKNAEIYLRLIAISWILQAWFYASSMIIREAGYGRVSLIASIVSLAFNIVFNSLFTYVFHFGVIGLAISTIISLIVPIILVSTFIFLKDKRLIINPLKIFMISKYVWKQIARRLPTFILVTIASVCINTRAIFWNKAYPTGTISNQEYQLSAADILGISGMFFNIFWTTFESINANITIFVGKELGNNNFEQAKKNAKQLQGFNALFSFTLGLILFSLSFAIEKMTFLTDGYIQSLEENNSLNIDKSDAIKKYMEVLKKTLWPLSWNMPIWIWYITKSRIISGGGKTNIVSLVDTTCNLCQIGWISIIAFVIVPNSNIEFPWAYALFFVSDILKIPLFEILYRKIEWARNITNEYKNP